MDIDFEILDEFKKIKNMIIMLMEKQDKQSKKIKKLRDFGDIQIDFYKYIIKKMESSNDIF